MSAELPPDPSAPVGDAANAAGGSLHHAHEHEEMVCYCFHVPLHKIENFIRRERPVKISMISHCLGAGTGCGTCVWDLKDIYKRVMAECAAEDAKNGIAPGTPASGAPLGKTPPPAAPFAPLAKVTGRQPVDGARLHSPSVDLGPIFAPALLPVPPLPGVLPATVPIPPAPRLPVSAESIEIELPEEPDDPPPPSAGPEDTP